MTEGNAEHKRVPAKIGYDNSKSKVPTMKFQQQWVSAKPYIEINANSSNASPANTLAQLDYSQVKRVQFNFRNLKLLSVKPVNC
jgi:hypothetical protein